MRIHVCFLGREPIRLPVNQNYFLASAIYNALSARPEYARFLHDEGYTHDGSRKTFKLFVFGPFMCRQRRLDSEELILGPGQIDWVISSPMAEFLTALAEGLLSQGEIGVRGTRLSIERVETEAAPEFAKEMSFTCLSPIVVSRPGASGEYAHFCTQDDLDFSERVRANLIRKHEIIYGQPPEDDSFEMRFDNAYIERRNGKVTKLIDIRGIYIRGVLAPFHVRGATELTRVGYETGFGERGSMGFGCAQIITSAR